MDAETRRLLESWGHPELIEPFQEEEIGIEALKALTGDFLKQYVPKAGPRLIFLKNISTITEQRAQPEVEPVAREILESDWSDGVSSDSEVTSAPPGKKRRISQKASRTFAEQKCHDLNVNRTVESLDLHKILTEDPLSHPVLHGYESSPLDQRELDGSGRKLVLQAVVRHLLSVSKELKNSHLQKVATKIAALFPTECEETYYVGPKTIGPKQDKACGKLVYMYRNLKEKIGKQLANTVPKPGPIPSTSEVGPYEKLLAAEKTVDIAQHDAAVSWLQTQNDPWTKAIENWVITAPLRLKKLIFEQQSTRSLKKIQSGNVYQSELELVGEYYEEWIILKHDSGYQLLLEDFKYLFPDKENNLYCNWDGFVAKCSSYASKNVKDAYGLDLLLKLKGNITKNSRDIITCLLLPSLCQPTMRIAVPSKPQWKVAVSESRKGFILHVQSTKEIKTAIKDRAKKYAVTGLNAQPFIVVVGETLLNIKHHFIAIDKVVYKVSNLRAALDGCFKAFFALHACYPKESEQLWLLIQKAVYHIDTAYDNKCLTSVNVCLKQLM